MNTRTPTGPRRAARVVGILCLLSLAPLSALAESGGDTVQAMRAELERMKAEQAARAADMRRLEERLAALEARAAQGAGSSAALPVAPAAATVAAAPALAAHPRLATGDPDDPNSSDVTLSNFADDFTVNLDQAYARYQAGDASVWGGKFALPFMRTDLVWDADVNPQGIGATWAIPAGGGTVRMAGLYFLVDQSVAGADSSM